MKQVFINILPLLFIIFIAGCKVEAIHPKNGAINSGTSPTIVVKFKSAIDSSSINSNTIKLYKGQYEYENIFGKIAYDPKRFIATFKPYDLLEKDQAYTLVIEGVTHTSAGSHFEVEKYSTLFFTTDKINHKGTTYTIKTSPYTGKKWLSQALQNNNSTSYYQWGSIIPINSSYSKESNEKVTLNEFKRHDYYHKAFVKNVDNDWLLGDPLGTVRKTLWKESSGFICPVGFKIPNAKELEQEIKGLTSTKIKNHFLVSNDGFYTHQGQHKTGFSNIRLWSTQFKTDTEGTIRYSSAKAFSFNKKENYQTDEFNESITTYHAYITDYNLTDALPIRCIGK